MVNMKITIYIEGVDTSFCVLILFLQSCQGKRENMIKESDRLFADGVRLYNEGKYKEAGTILNTGCIHIARCI